MLPQLCEAIHKPRSTNHQIRQVDLNNTVSVNIFIYRVTAVKALRRAGFDWHTISKISGHKNPQNLVLYYDLSLEVVRMLHAYCISLLS